jgi:hypothetical protein
MKKTTSERLYIANRNEFEEQKEERERIALEKQFCPHGMIRQAGPFDCHWCVEKELDAMVAADIEHQEHGV